MDLIESVPILVALDSLVFQGSFTEIVPYNTPFKLVKEVVLNNSLQSITLTSYFYKNIQSITLTSYFYKNIY
jgi:hypothetical protein